MTTEDSDHGSICARLLKQLLVLFSLLTNSVLLVSRKEKKKRTEKTQMNKPKKLSLLLSVVTYSTVSDNGHAQSAFADR